MDVIHRLHTAYRHEWRQWLITHHNSQGEIWLSVARGESDQGVNYLDAVEEALCFGWIDSTGKRIDNVWWQRFSPRRKNSNWTELNIARCERLEQLGLMTDAGRNAIPQRQFVIDNDILQALQADERVWDNFINFPKLYVRVRIDNIQKQRKRNSDVFNARLKKFIDHTRQGVMYGDWSDGGRLL